MSWQDLLIPMVRILINDFDCDNYTYNDPQLERTIAVAAMYVEQELTFSTNYTISINPPDISPDPTVTATKDDAFINFVVLKSACLTDVWQFRSKALLEGVKAWAGNSVKLEVLGHLPGFKTLLEEGPCKSYDELKMDYRFGNAHNIRAVLSPFISNEFLNPETIRQNRYY